MNNSDLAQLLTTMGCPEAKAGEMAAQLAKRSGQLAIERNIPRDRKPPHTCSASCNKAGPRREQIDAD